VSDGKGGQAGLSVQIAVVAEVGSANVTITFNTWSVVSQITGTPLGQVSPGGVVTLDVSATDSDGDSLTYAWTDDCCGVFAGTTTKSPSWTAPATYQSSATVKSSTAVRLYVTAHDPENTAPTFTWSATGGVLGTPTTTAGRSDVIWTAPTTPQITTNYTATVQIQDANV
jgi:hypothetical protein